MKIFVTGGSGFIGSNFIHKMVKSGNHTIFNLDKLSYAGNPNNLSLINNDQNYTFVQGDICDKSTVYKIFNEFEPNVVVNFAAESHVDRSIDSPIKFIETNIIGTFNLLEATKYYLQSNKIKNFKFLHISTDEVYGSTNDNEFFNEKSPYNPSSPYSASKASSDHLARAWYLTFKLPILITNCSNNYGPYQFPEKLIPLTIINCINEKQLPVYGNGENIREWLYVDDHCNAIYDVLKHGKSGETYNIGSNNEMSNINLVKTICTILDEIKPRSKNKSYKELITFVKDRPGHDFRYAIDSTKIKRELGWVPKENFESGLQKTINWYLENEGWWRKIQKNNYNQERLGIKK